MLHENTPVLETPRLILRRFALGDLDALYALLRDKEVNTFLPWFVPQSVAEAKDFLESRFLAYYGLESAYRYAICSREDNRPIGYVWLDSGDSHDFGYGLARELWHRGIVSEAAAAVVERIRAAGYPYITATHDVNNPHSGGVMSKLGMTYRYSYREQVQPKNQWVTFKMYQLNFDPADQGVYWDYRER